jgi:hypothetical protein
MKKFLNYRCRRGQRNNILLKDNEFYGILIFKSNSPVHGHPNLVSAVWWACPTLIDAFIVLFDVVARTHRDCSVFYG